MQEYVKTEDYRDEVHKAMDNSGLYMIEVSFGAHLIRTKQGSDVKQAVVLMLMKSDEGEKVMVSLTEEDIKAVQEHFSSLTSAPH